MGIHRVVALRKYWDRLRPHKRFFFREFLILGLALVGLFLIDKYL